MSDQGNTGFAGGTRGADPVPSQQITAPDGSTVLGKSDPPAPERGEQNEGYPDGDDVSKGDPEKAAG